MKDRVFLDTNILVYSVNEDSPYHQDVRRSFKKLSEKNELWISRQILREYAAVVTKESFMQFPLNSIEAAADLEKWISMFSICNENETVTYHFLDLLKKYSVTGRRIHDLNIVATMLSYDINLLLTYNVNDFKIFNEIKVLKIP